MSVGRQFLFDDAIDRRSTASFWWFMGICFPVAPVAVYLIFRFAPSVVGIPVEFGDTVSFILAIIIGYLVPGLFFERAARRAARRLADYYAGRSTV